MRAYEPIDGSREPDGPPFGLSDFTEIGFDKGNRYYENVVYIEAVKNVTLTAVFGCPTGWPAGNVLQIEEVMFVGEDSVVPLYWNADGNWQDDPFADEGTEIGPLHYDRNSAAPLPAARPVAFVKNTAPRLQVGLSYDTLLCPVVGTVHVTLSVGGIAMEYRKDNWTFEDDSTTVLIEPNRDPQDPEYTHPFPDMVLSTDLALMLSASFNDGSSATAQPAPPRLRHLHPVRKAKR